jgi:hypothetical protein
MFYFRNMLSSDAALSLPGNLAFSQDLSKRRQPKARPPSFVPLAKIFYIRAAFIRDPVPGLIAKINLAPVLLGGARKYPAFFIA